MRLFVVILSIATLCSQYGLSFPVSDEKVIARKAAMETLEALQDTLAFASTKGPSIVGRSISDERDDEPGTEPPVESDPSRPSEPTPQPEPKEPKDYPPSAVIAATVAVTLFVSYIGYLVVCMVYKAMNESGRGYFSVSRDEILPGPAMPKVSKIFEKGKDKITRPGGKPVSYHLPSLNPKKS
jgi:hypothetical protein